MRKSRNEVSASAMAFFLTILIPTHGHNMTMRTQRELRTLCSVLDLLAGQTPEMAADIVAQRIKAVELAMTDGDWNRAQHLELIAPEGASLIEKDEAWMLTKEAEVDLKLRGKGRGQSKGSAAWGWSDWSQGRGRGKDGGKEKSKKGAKEWKGFWKGQKAGKGEAAKEGTAAGATG